MVPSFLKKRNWILLFCILAGIALLVANRYHSQLWAEAGKLYDIYRDHHQLKKVISSFGPYAPLAYILLQVIQVVVAPIPGGAIEFLGGYLFGASAGMLYSMIGLILGSLVAFTLARIFERIAVEKFVSEQTRKKFDYLVEHEGVILSFILFLLPGFPKDALCYILGLTPMHLGIFLFISTVGRIPGTLIATLQGAKAFEHQYKLLLLLLGISTFVLLAFYVYHDEIHDKLKKLRRGKEVLGTGNGVDSEKG